MNDGLTLPLAVRSPTGELVALLLMNAKAANKSRERGELWTVVPPGDRVLPLEGARFSRLDARGTHYEAVLVDPSLPVVRAAVDRWKNLSADDLPERSGGSGHEPTLTKLAEVIASRRRELPEGSYTTLLFQKGEEKIRKKLGEEAIELLLARDRQEVVSEAADLVYHLLVLLEVTGVPVADVLAELEGRHSPK